MVISEVVVNRLYTGFAIRYTFHADIVSSPPLVFKIWTKRGVLKKLLGNRGLVERGVPLRKGWGFQTFSSVFLQKSMF